LVQRSLSVIDYFLGSHSRHSNVYLQRCSRVGGGAGVNVELIGVKRALPDCSRSSERFAGIRGLSLAPKTRSFSFSSDSLLSFLDGG
jgi:hypothetical protein